MNTIGITGGTGFVGHHLANLLKNNGNKVIVFTRHPEKEQPSDNTRYAYWDPNKNKIDLTAVQPLDAMVNLAGAGIANRRWTKKWKKQIVNSRVNGTAFLVSQLKAHAPDCKTFVSASAMGYYGPDRGGRPFTENAAPYHDFLGDTCVKWEAASLSAADKFRTVIFRFGHVLGKDGGAYPKMANPVTFGIVPILGTGNHVMSWIHIHDLVNILHAAITEEKLAGIYNAVSPNPVTQKQLVQTVARHKKGVHITTPVPAFFLKTLLGELGREILKSTTVSCQKLQDSGYNFLYPTIDKAITEILGKHHAYA